MNEYEGLHISRILINRQEFTRDSATDMFRALHPDMSDQEFKDKIIQIAFDLRVHCSVEWEDNE